MGADGDMPKHFPGLSPTFFLISSPTAELYGGKAGSGLQLQRVVCYKAAVES